jgi:hypothetical protein
VKNIKFSKTIVSLARSPIFNIGFKLYLHCPVPQLNIHIVFNKKLYCLSAYSNS